MTHRTGRSRQWTGLGAAFVCAGAASALALEMLPAPVAWIAAIWAAVFLGSIGVLERPWRPAPFFLLLNAAVLAIVVAGAEAYLAFEETRNSLVYADGYRLDDDLLGVVPAKGVHARSFKTEEGRLLYDVIYSIDGSGRRVAPPFTEGQPCTSILFFGCSFTFGEGLGDTETLPYQVGVRSNGRFRTYNFGYHAYGPHQMLAELEDNLVRRDVECPPRVVVYQAIPHHVLRVAGKVPFARHAPRYRLLPDGGVQRAGHFDDGESEPAPGGWRYHVRGQLEKSAIYRALTRPRDRTADDDDVRLTLAVVGRARDLVKAQFPGAEFHVLLWISWPEERHVYEQLQRGLRDLDIPVHLVEDILPGYAPGTSPYVLSDRDPHPSALANRLLADYVLTTIAPAAAPPGAATSNGSSPR